MSCHYGQLVQIVVNETLAMECASKAINIHKARMPLLDPIQFVATTLVGKQPRTIASTIHFTSLLKQVSRAKGEGSPVGMYGTVSLISAKEAPFSIIKDHRNADLELHLPFLFTSSCPRDMIFLRC